MSTSANFSDAQIARIWSDACQRYQMITGIDLTKSTEITRLKSADELLALLDAEHDRVSKHQDKFASIRKLLDPAMKAVQVLSTIASSGVAFTFPPGVLVFGAVNLLLKAAKNVGSAYDSIFELFEVLQAFVTRLKIHGEHVVVTELKDIIVKKLSLLLVVLGLSAKMIKQGRALRFIKNVYSGGEDSGLQAAIDQLASLSKQEDSLVQALNLSVGYDSLEGVTALQTDVSVLKTDVHQWISAQANRDESQDFEKILKSLRERLEPELCVQTDYDNVINEIVPGTGDWILSEAIFDDWINSRKWLLWISGGPGSGKTHLSARIIKYLTELFPQGTQCSSRTSVAYFFCRESNARTQSFEVILRTAAFQIARNDIAYAKYLQRTLTEDGQWEGGVSRIWKLLFVEFFKDKDLKDRAFFVVDGLDEALGEGYDGVESFLRHIRDFSSDISASPRLHFLLVGRPAVDNLIYSELEHLVATIPLSIKHAADVQKYIDHQLSRSRNLRKISKDFRDEVSRKLAGKTFLWVKLVLKEIASKNREGQMRDAVDRFPKDLASTIRHVLQGFSENNEDDIADLNELLTWVTCARRPLTLGELEVVMALNSPALDPLLELEGLLRKHYSTFFTLVREDGLGTSDLLEKARNAHGFVNDDAAVEEGEDDTDDDFHDDLQVFDSPKSTVVTISHLSFTEYFRSEPSPSTLVGVNLHHADLHLALRCMSLICDDEKVRHWDTNSIMLYSCANFLRHLRRVNRAIASIAEKHLVIEYLYHAFTAEATIARWCGRIKQPGTLLIESEDIVKTILEWVVDYDGISAVVAAWCRSVQDDVQKLLEPLASVFAKKWLQELTWLEFPCFRFVYSYIREFKLYPSAEPFTSGPGSSLSQNSDPPVSVSDIINTANWASFPKDYTWHLRIARLLRGSKNFSSAIEYYEKALALDDTGPWALAGLAKTCAFMKYFKDAIKWSENVLNVTTAGDPCWQRARADCLWLIATSKTKLLRTGDCRKADARLAWRHAFQENKMDLVFLDQYINQLFLWKHYFDIITVLQRLGDAVWTRSPGATHDVLTEYLHSRADNRNSTRAILIAARNLSALTWLIRAYLNAINVALNLTTPRRGLVSGLRCNLAKTYLENGDDDNAAAMFELALKDDTITGTTSPFFTLRRNSMTTLAEIYYARALAAEKRSEDPTPSIVQLEAVAKGTSTVLSISSPGISRAHVPSSQNKNMIPGINWSGEAELLLGLWHRNHGEKAKARTYFQKSISAALDLLTDDIDGNDAEGYKQLCFALLMAGDQPGARAAYQIMGKANETNSRSFDINSESGVESEGIKRTEEHDISRNDSSGEQPYSDSNSDPEDDRDSDQDNNITRDSDSDDGIIRGRDSGKASDNDTASGDSDFSDDDSDSDDNIDGEDNSSSKYLDDIFTCSGPCNNDIRSFSEVHICSSGCIETVFCDPCLSKLTRGGLNYRICSPDHEWFDVSYTGLPEIRNGCVRLMDADGTEEEMELRDWFSKLRKEWNI